MMRLFFLLLTALSFVALPVLAQSADDDADEDVSMSKPRDSIYYTLDDGIMTRGEMEEEARYVHGLCAKHVYQSRYFDCGCIAGAFMNEREKRGPMVLQDTILTELYRTGGKTAKCANAPNIAGTVYQECMDFSRIFRRLENNNEQYCQCTGNRVARDFSSYPYLGVDYIERLRVNALLTCERQFPAVHENY